MPHMIETHGDAAAFVSARIPAWHRLGTVTEDDLTVEDALRLAHLGGWEVDLMPLITADHDGNPLHVPDRYATVRRNPFVQGQSDVLGVGLSADYAIIQNEETAAWLQTLADEGGANVETAGSLHHGSQVFFTLRMPDAILVGGEDATDLYLTGITSHDGSLALTTIVTPVRVVCKNTATLALKGATVAHKVRHVGLGTEGKVAEAREALDLTFGYADKWSAAMEALLEIDMTAKAFDALVADQFLPIADTAAPATRTRVLAEREVLQDLYRQPTNEFGSGTAYSAFTTLTEWSEWVRPNDAVKAANSALFGTGRDFRQRTYATLAKA